MVDTVSAPASAVTPPSMGPPSIPYVPPITLEEAVVRARARIRHRAKSSSRWLIVAVVLLSLPLLEALAAIFPSDPLAKVPASAYPYALAVAGAYLFFCWATYRVLTDHAGVSYAVVAAGAALVAYHAYRSWSLVTDFQTASATKFMDPNSLYVSLVLPILALAAGAVAVLAGLIALPRAVPIAESA